MDTVTFLGSLNIKHIPPLSHLNRAMAARDKGDIIAVTCMNYVRNSDSIGNISDGSLGPMVNSMVVAYGLAVLARIVGAPSSITECVRQ